MLELQNITKKYDDRYILNNINLNVSDGEFVVLSGESGCGKTTLLHIIGGIEKPSAGKVIVNGKSISNNRELRNYLKNEVAFLFQNFALVDRKTVRQNLEMIPEESRSGCSMKEALDYVGLPEVAQQQVYKLSGGEQQRVALARVLMKKCNIILADEPTGSLDGRNALAVIELLKKLNAAGKTIIMVTHMEEYKKLADKVIDL